MVKQSSNNLQLKIWWGGCANINHWLRVLITTWSWFSPSKHFNTTEKIAHHKERASFNSYKADGDFISCTYTFHFISSLQVYFTTANIQCTAVMTHLRRLGNDSDFVSFQCRLDSLRRWLQRYLSNASLLQFYVPKVHTHKSLLIVEMIASTSPSHISSPPWQISSRPLSQAQRVCPIRL